MRRFVPERAGGNAESKGGRENSPTLFSFARTFCREAFSSEARFSAISSGGGRVFGFFETGRVGVEAFCSARERLRAERASLSAFVIGARGSLVDEEGMGGSGVGEVLGGETLKMAPLSHGRDGRWYGE